MLSCAYPIFLAASAFSTFTVRMLVRFYRAAVYGRRHMLGMQIICELNLIALFSRAAKFRRARFVFGSFSWKIINRWHFQLLRKSSELAFNERWFHVLIENLQQAKSQNNKNKLKSGWKHLSHGYNVGAQSDHQKELALQRKYKKQSANKDINYDVIKMLFHVNILRLRNAMIYRS